MHPPLKPFLPMDFLIHSASVIAMKENATASCKRLRGKISVLKNYVLMRREIGISPVLFRSLEVQKARIYQHDKIIAVMCRDFHDRAVILEIVETNQTDFANQIGRDLRGLGQNIPPPHLILLRISTSDIAGRMSAAKRRRRCCIPAPLIRRYGSVLVTKSLDR
jgi:hypothetical protein